MAVLFPSSHWTIVIPRKRCGAIGPRLERALPLPRHDWPSRVGRGWGPAPAPRLPGRRSDAIGQLPGSVQRSPTTRSPVAPLSLLAHPLQLRRNARTRVVTPSITRGTYTFLSICLTLKLFGRGFGLASAKRAAEEPFSFRAFIIIILVVIIFVSTRSRARGAPVTWPSLFSP